MTSQNFMRGDSEFKDVGENKNIRTKEGVKEK
jgi:hypothetical protein